MAKRVYSAIQKFKATILAVLAAIAVTRADAASSCPEFSVASPTGTKPSYPGYM